MDLFVLIISRLVPLLLMASVTLVLARVSFDIVARRSRRGGIAVFVLILAIGVLWVIPGVIRLRLMVSAARAYRHDDWARVDAALTELRERSGREDPSMTKDWITAELNMGNHAKAEALILESLRPGRSGGVMAEPQDVLMLGMARYRAGKFEPARRTLLAVPDAKQTDVFLRDYYLGRLDQRRGDLHSASRRFEAALAAQPHFYPALHHLVRCALLLHDPPLGARAIDHYEGFMSGDRERIKALRADVAGGTMPEELEFHVLIVQH